MTEPFSLLTSNTLDHFTQDDWHNIITDVARFLVAFGDGPRPLEQTAKIIANDLVQYLKVVIHSAMIHRQSLKKKPSPSGLPIEAEDILEVLVDDSIKFHRVEQLLQNWDSITEMLNAYDDMPGDNTNNTKRKTMKRLSE